jgi:hypothetical protein
MASSSPSSLAIMIYKDNKINIKNILMTMKDNQTWFGSRKGRKKRCPKVHQNSDGQDGNTSNLTTKARFYA